MNKFLAPLLVLPLLSGCGSAYDCASSDVKDTIRSILVDASHDERVVAAVSEMRVTHIATLEIDRDVGTYRCSAQLQYDPGDDKRLVTKDVEYGVQPVESDDADFQVLYDASEFRSFKIGVATNVGLSFTQAFQEGLYGP